MSVVVRYIEKYPESVFIAAALFVLAFSAWIGTRGTVHQQVDVPSLFKLPSCEKERAMQALSTKGFVTKQDLSNYEYACADARKVVLKLT